MSVTAVVGLEPSNIVITASPSSLASSVQALADSGKVFPQMPRGRSVGDLLQEAGVDLVSLMVTPNADIRVAERSELSTGGGDAHREERGSHAADLHKHGQYADLIGLAIVVRERLRSKGFPYVFDEDETLA
jgi:hypothetical protein